MGRVVHFEIHASDMDAAERFYTAVFGWTAQRTPSADRDYRLLVTGADGTPGINGALLERRGEAPAPGEPVSAFVCTVAVDDLDETDRRIAEQGGARVVETRAIEGVGRVAYFRDRDGNILGVIEPQRAG
jgi:predicted enzyme related to lactoylglutathione lyase